MMEGKLELISRYNEYYLVKSISNEDISLDDILLHNESGRIISVNRFWESNGSKTIMDTGLRNPIELVISGNTFKKLIGYYSEYQKLPLSKLSLKNCQAIENGYDLDELAHHNSLSYTWLEFDEKDKALMSKYSIEGFKAGFQKALEILGDKKFSEFDIVKTFEYGWNQRHFGKTDEDELREIQKRFIQSLQQTEWDVIIETIEYGLGNDENGRPVFETRNLLDADGCLILKRK